MNHISNKKRSPSTKKINKCVGEEKSQKNQRKIMTQI